MGWFTADDVEVLLLLKGLEQSPPISIVWGMTVVTPYSVSSLCFRIAEYV